MKKLVIFLFACCVAMLADAQKTLNVHLKSGGYVSYTFAEKPVVKYEKAELVLNTNTFNLRFSLADIQKFSFEDENLPTKAETISSMEPATDGIVRIYDINGRLLKTFMPDADGVTSYSVDELPSGIYVVKSRKTTYKINKR